MITTDDLIPITILPSQYWQTRFRPCEPERMLIAAILDQAFRDLDMYWDKQRLPGIVGSHAQCIIRDVQIWMDLMDHEPGGFAWCCEALHLSPRKVRLQAYLHHPYVQYKNRCRTSPWRKHHL